MPLIVVSGYTPHGFIGNSPEDFGSVVRFVERNFGILEGALTFADARGIGDLTEFFLTVPPHRFPAIKAPLSAKDFLSANRPASRPTTIEASVSPPEISTSGGEAHSALPNRMAALARTPAVHEATPVGPVSALRSPSKSR